MERIAIKDLHEHIDEEVTIAGWVDVRRDHGKLIFLDVRDGTGLVQSVALPDKPDVVETADTLRPEWVVSLRATVNKRPEKMVTDTPNGDIELELLSVDVLAQAAELPFEKDAKLNIDTYFDHMPLTLRSARSRAIFKVQAAVAEAYRESMRKRGFVEFQSPKLVGGDAEGGANVFKVEYFNDKAAYLATSPQLYKQILVGVFERVFTTSTVFRAEKHSTTRHLNEYTSLDAEFGFIDNHTDVMAVLGDAIREIVAVVREKCAAELQLLGADVPALPASIPSMKLREAQELITHESGEDCTGEPDLEPSHERWLCEWAKREHDSDFVFVTHYPVEKRPFYTYEDEDDPGFTKSFDLLCRGVEITTGGQRIHDYDTMIENMKAKGLQPENFNFYLQAFKYGMPPHGGWGMGLERLTQKILGLDSVKEAALFPRDMNRIDSRLSDE